jgi:hypothetical protein
MKKILFILLFLVAFLERTVWDLGPNIELVTTVMILATFYIGKKEAFWLIAVVMILSDLVLGNTNIFLFTWSGFLIPVLLIKKLHNPLSGLGIGLGSNLFFYIWTNFGVWTLDSWGMYPKTIQGLVSCFINGLPFLKYQFTSTLLFLPFGFVIFELGLKALKYFQTRPLELTSPA